MRYLLAIPVHNEADHVLGVLDQVRAQGCRDVLVIDDGSTDATPDLLRRRPDVHTIRHPENRGYGQSLIAAFAYAARRGYDWVVTMDCDKQHEPQELPAFLDAIRRDDADIISGSRYLCDFAGDDPPPPERRRINRTVTDLLDQLLGLNLTDSFCGFKAHRVAALQRLQLDEPGYAFPLQFWVQCVRAGLRIRELPIRRIYRDTSREFGATLDDPAARLQHYLVVLLRALCREPRFCLEEVRPLCRCSCAD